RAPPPSGPRRPDGSRDVRTSRSGLAPARPCPSEAVVAFELFGQCGPARRKRRGLVFGADRSDDRGPALRGRSSSTDIRGTRTIAGYVLESLQDERAGIALAEVFEHEGGRPHRCHGVSDPTPGDLRRRSVDGLEERGIPPGWVEVRRGGQPKRTLERSPKVGQDIGVEV